MTTMSLQMKRIQLDGVHDVLAASGDVDVMVNHLSDEWHNEHVGAAT